MARYGAIDIGSNSIRMQAAEWTPGEPPRLIAEDREVTRLGESVFRQGQVSPEAMDQMARVLRRMAEALRQADVSVFRAVATSAVRDSRNQDEVLLRAQLALGGVRPEIISGAEEARLIHLGVQTRWPHPAETIFIIDIGGGSAEIIESKAGQVLSAVSKPVGAVRLTEMFFAEDPPGPGAVRQFTEYVREKIGSIRSRTRPLTFDRVIVTAATAAAVVRAIHNVPASERDQVDRKAVKTGDVCELFRSLTVTSLRERQILTGIGSRRAEIIVAGCGALALILETMGAETCYYSAAGVRDGVIADLAARAAQFDRARLDAEQRTSVRSLAERCSVDLEHVERVAILAGRLFDDLAPLHGLDARYGGLLEAAAYLHDVGHFISSTRHHRHSFYIVANADLPAFENVERLFVANLCRYHRKNMPKPGQDNFRELDPKRQEALLRLIPLLRIADSLDRSHRRIVTGVSAGFDSDQTTIRIEADGDPALEEWAVRQHADVFSSVYGPKLRVST